MAEWYKKRGRVLIITQHYEHCTNDFNKDNFTVVHNMQDKKKGLAYNLKVREAFEIRRHNCGPGKGLNEDNGHSQDGHLGPRSEYAGHVNHVEEVGIDGGTGGPTLDWVSLVSITVNSGL